MIFKYELRFVAFRWPNLCSLDLSLLFTMPVGRNFVPGICKWKPNQKLKKLKPKKNFKTYFCLKKKFFPAPALFTFVCHITGRRQSSWKAESMTSSMEESSPGHVGGGGGASDVNAESLLVGCIDDVTSLRAPASKHIKVFVCSTGTGRPSHLLTCMIFRPATSYTGYQSCFGMFSVIAVMRPV